MTKRRVERVGIVMLVYNRADVAAQCIRSLALARNETPWELFLLDNASRTPESERVRAEFDRFAAEGRIRGHFARSEVNTGFPGGNNVGIRSFLERDDVSHICLLNSDVVVSDHWLDRLLESDADAVGPVTNACGNEQTIPIPFALGPSDDIPGPVQPFAEARYRSFRGHSTRTDFLGFFCFVARSELFYSVGLLDEGFGRGAYEDDDFCVRAIARGYRMAVARDVFVFHWGTASFSQLPQRALARSLLRNRRRFELKHGLAWKDRQLLPLVGVFDDVRHIARRAGSADAELADLYFRRSLDYVRQLLMAAGSPGAPGILDRIVRRLKGLWRRSGLPRALKAIQVVAGGRLVILPVRHPTDADMKDGYFQRVLLIDENLSNCHRLFVRRDEGQRRLLPSFSRKRHRVHEMTLRPGSFVHAAVASALALASGRIYVHSVLRLQERLFRLLYRLARVRILDVHGAVPEEFRFHGDERGAREFGDIERWAVERASLVVVVTEAMAEHLTAKYGARRMPPFSCLSMLPRTGRWGEDGADPGERRGIVYSGGLHKWQQLDKMLEMVRRDGGQHRFTFLVTDPDELKRRYRALYQEDFPQAVASAPPDQVAGWYEKHAYGLVLREAVVVNAVACPTKLVEYLQHGLVPIVDSPDIGDFRRLGYQYVEWDRPLPSEPDRAAMADANRRVLRRMYLRFLYGLEQLHAVLGGTRKGPADPRSPSTSEGILRAARSASAATERESEAR